MEQKSIIGCGYVPRDAKAVCLKTDCETFLGGVEYKIIAAPYERSFIKLHNPGGTRLRYDAMAVNILDPLTGLTYAVEYHPANLVRKDAAATESPKMDSAAFSERVQSLALELHRIMEANPDLKKDCAILILCEQLDENGENLSATRLIAGKIPILEAGLVKLASKKSEIGDLLIDASKGIMLKRILSKLSDSDRAACGR